jgi:hypothetical protein
LQQKFNRNRFTELSGQNDPFSLRIAEARAAVALAAAGTDWNSFRSSVRTASLIRISFIRLKGKEKNISFKEFWKKK